MRRGLWWLVAATTLLFFTLPSTARATDELGLSWDGLSWSEQLSQPMFDPAVRWVPGDAGTTSFFVRNQAESGGILSIAVVTEDEDGLLSNGDVDLSARIGTRDWVDLNRTDRILLLNDDALPMGASRKVEVRALFDFASPNRSQNKYLEFSFRVTLSDANASPPSPEPGGGGGEPADPVTPGDNTGSNGSLPNAGAPRIGWFIVAAGVGIGSGMKLLTRRKREDSVHEPAQ